MISILLIIVHVSLFTFSLYAQDSVRSPLRVTFTGYNGDTSTGLEVLRQEIANILLPSKYKKIQTACKVVLFNPDNTLIPIYSLNEDGKVLPASVEKLFTTSTIQWALGSDYQFKTRLDMPNGTRIEGSSVIGNIYLRPSGDPTLKMNDFDDLARYLRTQGIRQIEGDIISDLSVDDNLTEDARQFFANGSYQTSQSDTIEGDLYTDLHQSGGGDRDIVTDEEENVDDDTSPGFFSSYPNFYIDRNVVTVRVSAGTKAGQKTSVSLYPPIPGIRIANLSTTSPASSTRKIKKLIGKGKKARWKTITEHIRGVTTLRIGVSASKNDNHQHVTLSGQLPAGRCRNFTIPIKDVPLAMAALLKWRLEENGIRVTGSPRTGKLKQVQSVQTLVEKNTPLLELLRETNKRSDNYLAESMFRKLSTIGDRPYRDPRERARAAMDSWMNVLGIDPAGYDFADGSGLSRQNQLTPSTVISLLHGIRSRPQMYDDFVSTLSIAGVDGTTRGRMIGTPAENNAYSKTGTLNGVTTLAGFVTTRDGQLAAYFISMQNFGRGASAYKRIQDAIVTKLASFSYSDYSQNGSLPTFQPVTAPAR